MAKIGYIRVSSLDQNIERQQNLLAPFKLDKIFTEKLSGKNMNRPELKKMMDYARESDIIHIESISRLARSVRDLLIIVDQLQKKHVEIFSLKENFLTSTAQGRFMLTVFGALSELERENILERQKEGLDNARAKGKIFGRPKIEKPKDFDKVIKLVNARKITAVAAMKQLGLNRGTFYRLKK